MSWIAHVIRQGEHLDALALRYGFDAEQIWQDSRNEQLRQQRSNPSMLAAGDILHMPDEPQSARHCAAGSVNRYRGRVPHVTVAIRMADGSVPLADQPYVVHGLPQPIEGTTDADGNLSFLVPVGIEEVMLDLVALQRRHPIRVGHLDPPETSHGVLQRLRHLGLLGVWIGEGDVPAAQDEQLRDAICSFQRTQGLEATGAIDEQTRSRLVEVHGS